MRISRRKLLIASPAILVSRKASAWFPHGSVVSAPAPTITFNITHDASWDYISNGGQFPNLPDTTKAQADAVITRVCSDLASWFTVGSGTAATVNINIGWGPTSHVSLASGIAETVTSSDYFRTYATVRGILLGLPTDAVKTAGYNSTSLPVSDPENAGFEGYMVPTATWAIWHGLSDTGQSYVAFAKSGWDFTVDGKTNSNGGYSFYNTVTHEFIYQLNHLSSDALPTLGSVAELFAYHGASPVGAFDPANYTTPRYFSLDGGATSAGSLSYNQGECASFNSGVSPLNIYAQLVGTWRQIDYKCMSILGMTLTAAGRTVAGI